MKKCTKCGIEKPLSEYYKNSSQKSGLQSKCKPCHEKSKIKSKLSVYGLTIDDFNQILAKQNNCCAICEIEFTSTRFRHVDHCHKTNKVRGILCHSCNTSLVHFKDSIQALTKAIEYISHGGLET